MLYELYEVTNMENEWFINNMRNEEGNQCILRA